MELRKEVTWFAQEMESKLRVNDHKGGWEKCSTWFLFARLCEEVKELQRSLFAAAINAKKAEEVIKEAADVANFAMMIADLEKKKITKGATREEMM